MTPVSQPMFYFPALVSVEGTAILAGDEGHHAGGAP